ncbi:MAG TPA: hypothetical protein VFH73_16530 [Polyangia bacterium]|nr:hypothetical protein [Polyangia bacterium]
MSVGAAGCYDPNISNGGLLCAANAKCPDGFKCNPADQKCYKTSGGADARPDAPICTFPVVTPTCSDAPKMNQKCNPVCQNGCQCGRCNVIGKEPTCTAIGAKTVGQVCNLSADDCSAGLICLQEACGGGTLGRCYKYCSKADQCGGPSCQIPVLAPGNQETGFLVCDVAAQDCDPVAKTGCPSPSLNCYLTSANQTLCDCPNRAGMLGEACTIYSDCATGLVCVSNLAGLAGSRCAQICSQQSPNCPAAMHCIPSGMKYGYCGL